MKEKTKEMRGMFLQLGNNMWRDGGFCRKNIASERLHGFLMTTWGPTLPSCEAKLAKGIDLAAAALS